MMAAMPPWALGLMIAGGLWLFLWTSRARLLGLVPILLGAAAAAASPKPDVLVTGDGRHLAIVDADGTPLLLRERSGEFIRSIVADSRGSTMSRRSSTAARSPRARATAASRSSSAAAGAGKSRDPLRPVDRLEAAGPRLRRGGYRRFEPWLPRGCTPRWLKLDRDSARHGPVESRSTWPGAADVDRCRQRRPAPLGR